MRSTSPGRWMGRALLLAGMVCAASLDAQAPQAVLNASDAVNTRDERLERERLTRIVAQLQGRLAQLLESRRVVDDTTRTASAAQDAVARALSDGAHVLATPPGYGNAAVFRERLQAFERSLASLDAALDAVAGARTDPSFRAAVDAQRQDLVDGRRALAMRSSAVPALFGPAVNFTLGYNATAAATGRSGVAHDLELGTNLVGAVAGTVFGGLSDAKLGTYLKQNLSFTVGMPTTSGRRLTSTAAIALGEFPLGEFVVWPTLAVTQMDTADRRVPEELGRNVRDRASWSAPSLSIALMRTTRVPCVREGKCFPPVFVVGATMPQYYPGNPYAAIGALFSDDREKYRQSGRWRWTAGLAVPLRGLERKAS